MITPPPTPPPMRICIKGWFTWRDLTMVEAEAYHLKKAAKEINFPAIQRFHLEQAARNREWRNREAEPSDAPPRPLPSKLFQQGG